MNSQILPNMCRFIFNLIASYVLRPCYTSLSGAGRTSKRSFFFVRYRSLQYVSTRTSSYQINFVSSIVTKLLMCLILSVAWILFAKRSYLRHKAHQFVATFTGVKSFFACEFVSVISSSSSLFTFSRGSKKESTLSLIQEVVVIFQR